MADNFQSRNKRNKEATKWLGFAFLLLLITAAAFMISTRSRSEQNLQGMARITSKNGEIQIKRQSEIIPFEQEFLLLPGDKVRTKEGATMEIALLNSSGKLRVAPTTVVLFEPHNTMTLTSGCVEFAIDNQPQDKPVTVVTPNTETIVTKPGSFTLAFSEMKTQAKVSSGELQVRSITTGRTTRVEKGGGHTVSPKDSGRIEFQMDMGS